MLTPSSTFFLTSLLTFFADFLDDFFDDLASSSSAGFLGVSNTSFFDFFADFLVAYGKSSL